MFSIFKFCFFVGVNVLFVNVLFVCFDLFSLEARELSQADMFVSGNLMPLILTLCNAS